MKESARFLLPGLFLLGALAYAPGLGSETALTQTDEFRVSMRAALERSQGGSFWVPQLDGEPRLAKPPLFTWILFLFTGLWGPTLGAVRLPGVLFAAGAACLSESIARRLHADAPDPPPPGTVGLLVAASLGFGVLGRLALLDVPLVFFVLLAVDAWLRFEANGARGWSLAAFAALGLAALVKGPMGPWVGGAAIATRIALGGAARARRGDLALGLAVWLAVSFAWPLAMLASHGSAFVDIVYDEVITKRFAREGSGGATSVLGGLLLLAAPWTLLFLASLGSLVRGPDGSERRSGRWLLCWIGATLLPFVFASSGFERYAMPALPAALVLAAGAAHRRDVAMRVARGATAVVLSGAGAALLIAWIHFGIGPTWALALAAASLSFFAVALLRGPALRTAAVAFLGFQSLFFGALYPALDVNRLPDGLASEIGTRRIARFGSRPPALLEIAIGRPLERFDEAAIDEFAASDGWIAVSGESRAKLEDRLRGLGYRWQVVREWRSLHTRSTAVQLYRRSARGRDLRNALTSGSLDGLKESFALLGGLEGDPP